MRFRVPSALVVLVALALVGCSSSPGSDGGGGKDARGDGGEAVDVADGQTAGACEIRVDGSCYCPFEGAAKGVCARGRWNSEGGTCAEPSAYEQTESTCTDGLDNDCDGDTDCEDSNCTGSGCGIGQGTATCVAQECTEIVCYDGVDNDEDGKTDCLDPDCAGDTCDESTGQKCPKTEKAAADESKMCDGLDNDCDGATDEKCECTFDPNANNHVDDDGSHRNGVCTGLTLDSQGVCPRPQEFESRTGAEAKCDGKDNDCDGRTDEGCPCQYDPKEPDHVDTDDSHDDGVCSNQSSNAKGECKRPSTFETETDKESHCNGKDDDCDGTTDEGCPCSYDPTESKNVDTDSSHAYGVCTGQTRDKMGVCSKPSGFEKTQKDAESGSSCGSNGPNGKDDDCDGNTDEGCPCTYDPNETNNIDTDGSHASGVCPGQSLTSNGVCPKPASNYSKKETTQCSDNIDNDCDGDTDEFSKWGGQNCSKNCMCSSGCCSYGSTCGASNCL